MHAHGGGGDSERDGAAHLAGHALHVVLLVVAGIRALAGLAFQVGHNRDFGAAPVAGGGEGRPPSATKTVDTGAAMAALVNALSLVAVSFFIFDQAFQRLQHPQHVHAGLMIGVAAAGVAMNGDRAAGWWWSQGDVNVQRAAARGGRHALTERALAGGFAILWTGLILDRRGAVGAN